MIYNLKNEIKKYWVLFKEPIIKECRNHVYMVVSDKENLQNPMINENHVVYVGTELLNHPFLQEDGTIREATHKELIDKGIYSLEEHEVLVGDEVKSIYEFPIPEGTIKPIFDKEVLIWKESATPEEIALAEHERKINFYNSELELANKAFTEYDLGMATEDDIIEVKSYMSGINPFKEKTTMRFRRAILRPSIFQRYENQNKYFY